MKGALFAELTRKLGCRIDDAELLAMLARIGCKPPKATTDGDWTSFVTSKAQGLELVFSHIVHDRAKYPPVKEQRRYVTYFTGGWLRERFAPPLPGGLDWSMTRADLEKRYGAPIWTQYDDNDLPDRERFLVTRGKHWTLECEWSRLHRRVSNVQFALNEARDLGTADTPTGMFAAWAALRVGLGARHAKTAHAKKLLARTITGRQFVREACGGVLWTDDIAEELGDFAYGYCAAACGEGKAWRKATKSRDDLGLSSDFETTFSECGPDFDLVADTWQTWERLAPLLDARWSDYRTTKFRVPPPAKLYTTARAAQQAAKKAGSAAIAPAKAAAVSADLTDRLVALIGKPSTDAAVLEMNRELGLRLPKKHEDIADTKRGFWIDYAKASGKKSFVVQGITFLPAGRHDVRFDGELRFAGYAAPMPGGVAFTDSRRALEKKLGKPVDADEFSMEWAFKKERRRLIVWFDGKKIQWISWLGPPTRNG